MGLLNVFVNKCGNWGLLPNNVDAKKMYNKMEVVGQMGHLSGFSSMLNKLYINVPDLNEVMSLDKLKQQNSKSRLSVLLTCHEIIHNLHWLYDKKAFSARSKKKVAQWDNEEELLTITGKEGIVALQNEFLLLFNPKKFNEHALCSILKIKIRSNHKDLPDPV